MRVAHLLRKCSPTEWGGTETAMQRLFDGLRRHGVDSVVYCPRADRCELVDPLVTAGCTVKRFKAVVPIWGITPQRKRQLISVGGNLISFDLMRSLGREQGLSLIHTHTLGRLGAIAAHIARRRGVPLVVTIHGGLLDLPEALKASFRESRSAGWEWGRLFGLVLRSRRLLDYADAILACNTNEARLLQAQEPGKRIVVQPHGVPTRDYESPCREAARLAFPQVCNQRVLLVVGRIDPVKNQVWLVEQVPSLVQRHPDILLVLAGACTDARYGSLLDRRIQDLGVPHRVLRTGGLPPGDPRLVGLYQDAAAVVLPSLSETFGLVILEAWAAGALVISSRTSGALALIKDGQNGQLFDWERPETFHDAIDQALRNPDRSARLAAAGRRIVRAEFDATALAGRMKDLYQQLIEAKDALRHSAR